MGTAGAAPFIIRKKLPSAYENKARYYMLERSKQRLMRSYLSEFGLSIKQSACRHYKSIINYLLYVRYRNIGNKD